jgi:hypothetical protein
MKRTIQALAAASALVAHGAASADTWGDPEPAAGADFSADATIEAQAGPGPGFGIGAAATVSGIVGLELAYHLSDQAMIVGLLSLGIVSPSVGDSVTTVVVGGGGFYRLAGGGDSGLYMGGRLILANSDPGTQVNIEIPMRAQIWLSGLLAFHLEAGLTLAFIPNDGVVAPPGLEPDSTVISLGGRLFGAGGFTLFFL